MAQFKNYMNQIEISRKAIRDYEDNKYLKDPVNALRGLDKNELENILSNCSSNGNLDYIKYLIEKQNIDVDCKNAAALKNASYNGHLDIVKYLIYKGADIHHSNDYALRNSSINGHLDIVKYLVENGANIHAKNDEALKYAGNLDVTKYLVSKYDPQYIIDKFPKFIKHLSPEYSHTKLADKFGVFNND